MSDSRNSSRRNSLGPPVSDLASELERCGNESPGEETEPIDNSLISQDEIGANEVSSSPIPTAPPVPDRTESPDAVATAVQRQSLQSLEEVSPEASPVVARPHSPSNENVDRDITPGQNVESATAQPSRSTDEIGDSMGKSSSLPALSVNDVPLIAVASPSKTKPDAGRALEDEPSSPFDPESLPHESDESSPGLEDGSQSRSQSSEKATEDRRGIFCLPPTEVNSDLQSYYDALAKSFTESLQGKHPLDPSLVKQPTTEEHVESQVKLIEALGKPVTPQIRDAISQKQESICGWEWQLEAEHSKNETDVPFAAWRRLRLEQHKMEAFMMSSEVAHRRTRQQELAKRERKIRELTLRLRELTEAASDEETQQRARKLISEQLRVKQNRIEKLEEELESVKGTLADLEQDLKECHAHAAKFRKAVSKKYSAEISSYAQDVQKHKANASALEERLQLQIRQHHTEMMELQRQLSESQKERSDDLQKAEMEAQDRYMYRIEALEEQLKQKDIELQQKADEFFTLEELDAEDDPEKYAQKIAYLERQVKLLKDKGTDHDASWQGKVEHLTDKINIYEKIIRNKSLPSLRMSSEDDKERIAELEQELHSSHRERDEIAYTLGATFDEERRRLEGQIKELEQFVDLQEMDRLKSELSDAQDQIDILLSAQEGPSKTKSHEAVLRNYPSLAPLLDLRNRKKLASDPADADSELEEEFNKTKTFFACKTRQNAILRGLLDPEWREDNPFWDPAREIDDLLEQLAPLEQDSADYSTCMANLHLMKAAVACQEGQLSESFEDAIVMAKEKNKTNNESLANLTDRLSSFVAKQNPDV